MDKFLAGGDPCHRRKPVAPPLGTFKCPLEHELHCNAQVPAYPNHQTSHYNIASGCNDTTAFSSHHFSHLRLETSRLNPRVVQKSYRKANCRPPCARSATRHLPTWTLETSRSSTTICATRPTLTSSHLVLHTKAPNMMGWWSSSAGSALDEQISKATSSSL